MYLFTYYVLFIYLFTYLLLAWQSERGCAGRRKGARHELRPAAAAATGRPDGRDLERGVRDHHQASTRLLAQGWCDARRRLLEEVVIVIIQATFILCCKDLLRSRVYFDLHIHDNL